ncbi:MAG: PAS domain-containing protein, partial [Candidatus Marinimicrobia bacterium]|nr:PAS domain-containing protein [Candidatus Neomarinimicrobiota bacterium]
DTPDRLFPRSPAIIGREVQKCHPPKSVHIVNDIVAKFKAKEKDVAEFWIQMNGKFIHIRYFPVYDNTGNYKGVIEVSQEISGIKKLEGQRRLLDW